MNTTIFEIDQLVWHKTNSREWIPGRVAYILCEPGKAPLYTIEFDPIYGYPAVCTTCATMTARSEPEFKEGDLVVRKLDGDTVYRIHERTFDEHGTRRYCYILKDRFGGHSVLDYEHNLLRYKSVGIPVSDAVLNYIQNDLDTTYKAAYIHNDKPIKVIFNDPATIVFWRDGSKTVVKAQPGEVFDPEKGLAMAIAKHALDNQGSYYEVFKYWLPQYVEANRGDRGE